MIVHENQTRKNVLNVQIHLAHKLLFEPRIQKFHKDSKEARHQCNTNKSTEKEPDPNYKQLRNQNETKTSLLVDYRNCDDCTVYSVTFEEETREIDKEQDNDKDEDEDETIDLHIRRHKIEKEHVRKMEEAKMYHELYRTGIIGPCSVIAIGIICTLIYFIIIKPGKTDPTNKTRNHAPKRDLKMKMIPTTL